VSSLRRTRVTSRQVARHAGVSQTTVSLVLNNAPNAHISQATRERVFEAARELGYAPDAAARSLARGRSSNIGLVLVRPHEQIFIDEYLPTLLTGLNQLAHRHGYRILVDILDNPNQAEAFTHLVTGKEVAGLIVQFGNPTQAVLDQLAGYSADGFPMVALGRWPTKIPTVEVDKIEGVAKMVRHLIRLGHTRIGCIPYAPLAGNWHLNQRLGQVRATLAEAGLTLDDAMIEPGAYDPKTGYEATLRLLKRKPWPTALFAMNDVMAFGALEALRQSGVRVPQDLAVVGFDDIRLAAFASPPLTTVREPDAEMGRQAAQLLLDQIEGREMQQRDIRLETTLVIRESCGAKKP
jgi:LacI family transcriptional regulator